MAEGTIKGPVFDIQSNLGLDAARMSHLARLGLDLNRKSVIDIGTGAGDLTRFFINHGCDVLTLNAGADDAATDDDNVDCSLDSSAPVVDIENDALSQFGKFEVVSCYGVLGKSARPQYVLENLGQVCGGVIIVEADIVDDAKVTVELEAGSCRVSPAYVIQQLRRCGFSEIYVPKNRPEHEDFLFEYRNDRSQTRDGHPMRQIFISSLTKLELETLQEVGDGLEFFGADPLEKLTLKELTELAKQRYRPEPLSRQTWYVGKTEETLPESRIELARLWRVLRLKSVKRPQVAVDWHEGIHLKLSLDDEIARCVFVEGVFEPNEFVLIDRYLQKGMTFIDAGANNGLYTVFAARKVGWRGRVLAYEPSEREFEKLKANLSANRFLRVSSFKKALGDSQGEVQLSVATLPYSGHNSLGHFGYEGTRLERQETVALTTIDAEVKSAHLHHVDVLKADVEGAEMALLRGARETLGRFQPMVLVELSDRTLTMQGTNSGEVVAFLEGLGYKLYQFDGEGRLEPLAYKSAFDGLNVVGVAGARSAAVLEAGMAQGNP
jgi:FkbM family methyltransferase